jgi:hypothetical protein
MQPDRCRVRRWVWLAMALVCTGWQLGAQGTGVGPPAWIEVEPNAIQKSSEPMRIDVGGIPQGQTVRLLILQDCHGTHKPDLQGEGGCRSPLYERDSKKADERNVVRDRLEFQALEKEGAALPHGRALWLLASRPGSRRGVGVLALFGLVDDPCTLWTGFLETFHLGSCSATAVRQSLRHHRGPLALAGKMFEVRRLAPAGDGRPVSVAGTRGATGVSWQDASTLLVTVALTGGPDVGEASRTALLRVSLRGGEPTVLWSSASSEGLAVAPLALPGGGVAFVRQRLSAEDRSDGRPTAVLSTWEEGKVDLTKDLPLPFRIHQLVASSANGQSILALTLGVGDNQPGFVQIDLAERMVLNLGYGNSLYQAAMHSPKGDTSVVSLEDNSGQTGWDLVLVDGKGNWVKDLQVRPEDDILPAWRPDGAEIAYLAEIERAGKQK